MPIRLKLSPNYILEKTKIREDLVKQSTSNSDAKSLLSYFHNDEKGLKLKIKGGPLYAGEPFVLPVRRGVTNSGKYAIFFTPLPVEAKENVDINLVNLDSIVPAEPDAYNNIILNFKQADYKD
jgi:hypothetical protein